MSCGAKVSSGCCLFCAQQGSAPATNLLGRGLGRRQSDVQRKCGYVGMGCSAALVAVLCTRYDAECAVAFFCWLQVICWALCWAVQDCLMQCYMCCVAAAGVQATAAAAAAAEAQPGNVD